MRLGVISDIHGVADALGAVLRDGERLGVERWWVLDDLVLFGAHPVEVVEMLTALNDVAFVAGKTDRYLLTDDPRSSRVERSARPAEYRQVIIATVVVDSSGSPADRSAGQCSIKEVSTKPAADPHEDGAGGLTANIRMHTVPGTGVTQRGRGRHGK